MSFIKRWDADKIISDLNACNAQLISPYNDGFTQWSCKEDLIRVKYALDEILENSPTFAPENKFIEEMEKQKTWKKLNAKNT